MGEDGSRKGQVGKGGTEEESTGRDDWNWGFGEMMWKPSTVKTS